MFDRLRFIWNRLKEKLWVRPLAMVFLSIGLAFLARWADSTHMQQWVPDISVETIDSLLTIIASSMLIIATFSVASMWSAYASASNTATPRSFPLIVADDVSQNALSTFIGAFIFSIVALTALKNSYYDVAGRFALFSITLLFFCIVILPFVRWVDRIARLGRLGNTIENVEKTASQGLRRQLLKPYLGGMPLNKIPKQASPIRPKETGYIQRVDLESLQEIAENKRIRIFVTARPGVFATPERILAHVSSDAGENTSYEEAPIVNAFRIGSNRTFDEDPRFGLIVLSEIASRALSPAVNDPGTAIDVIGRLVRLFYEYVSLEQENEIPEPEYDRIEVAPLVIDDLFEDAFSGVARDGASTLEVAVRLQKALRSIAEDSPAHIAEAAKNQARLAMAHAEVALKISQEKEKLRQVASFTDAG